MTVKQGYTILKALTQDSTKGFTLVELMVGTIIMLLVGGFTMNSLIESSKSFNEDKRNVQSAQNLTAVLELIGNDVKQAGERIVNDNSFPTIEITQEPAGTLADGSPVEGSTLIVRRALTTAMPLCEDLLANDAARTRVTVADTASPNTNCNAIGAGSVLATTLTEAQNYRCELGDPNAAYNASLVSSCTVAAASANNDASLQRVMAVVSNREGRLRQFTYTGEDATGAPNRFRMEILATAPLAAGDPNNVDYNVGDPIYLIEERRYTLDSITGNLRVSTDGGASWSTLARGIAKFKVSARAYLVTPPGDTPVVTLNDRVIDPSGLGAGLACTAADGVAMPTPPPPPTPPTPPTAADPIYACRLKLGNNIANWKRIAGVRIELQAKYDSTGRASYADAAAIPENKDINKLRASAEYFPRNVLSR